MKASPVKPFLWLMSLIVVVSLACGGTAAVPTATQAPPPTNTPLPPPTDTPVPPTPTTPPTVAPTATTESAPPPPPIDPGPALPANCIDSDDAGYISCYDDTGSIVVDIPDYWTDVNGGEWEYDNEIIGVAISAAPNLDDFNAYFDVEGMFFGASDTFATIGGYVQFLDYYTDIYRGDCDLVERADYNDGVYRGKVDIYDNCGGRGGYDTYVLSAVDIVDPTAMIIVLMIQVMPGDTFTVDQIYNTFFVLDI